MFYIVNCFARPARRYNFGIQNLSEIYKCLMFIDFLDHKKYFCQIPQKKKENKGKFENSLFLRFINLKTHFVNIL